MKPILKHIAIAFSLAFCTSAFAQSKIATTPTTELYGYYHKGQNFETMQKDIQNYEALLLMAGYIKQNSHIASENDYTILWRYKHENGGEIDAQIHYQFLIPYFKITIDQIIATYPNGNMAVFSLNSKDEAIREMYADLYNVLVKSLVRLIKPAKTITKEQLREALNNLDKMPEIKND
ncbi:hypothetical protein COR50_11845 [Chitinophaga caeni]|uniref:DUF4468 domain-containing protein n=1 Tax=Chitinophaga caeni TaxID=2029983 RepID=A0A291QV88_9BACT|nr:hypothetical protein [Chitinophaga caeni]ATL47802.1 hypothetical protein COR50_11845 [Chitinophaga caeni]